MQDTLLSPVFGSSRGAKFLSMVNQKQLNVSPQISKLNKKRRSSICIDLMRARDLEGAANEKKDYLKFSSEKKFNPNASPSSSILSKPKSEFNAPDTTPLSSSAKRKRVGFRDPVSSTKEYIITAEEESLKSSFISARCLVYNNDDVDVKEEDDGEVMLPQEDEHLIELKEDVALTVEISEIKIKTDQPMFADDVAASPIPDHDYENQKHTDITTSETFDGRDKPEQSFNDEKLVFKDKNEMMDYITKNVSADEIFEKMIQAEEQSLKRKELISKVIKTVGFDGLLSEYFSSKVSDATKLSIEQNSLILTVIAEVSKLMETNVRIKHKVLDILSEKHSEEFLQHALQENSPTVICNQLTLPKVVNYVIHKVNTTESDESNEQVNQMNRAIMHRLVNNTVNVGKEVVPNREYTEELLNMLFKNKARVEVLDTAYDFVKKLLKNH